MGDLSALETRPAPIPPSACAPWNLRQRRSTTSTCMIYSTVCPARLTDVLDEGDISTSSIVPEWLRMYSLRELLPAEHLS